MGDDKGTAELVKAVDGFVQRLISAYGPGGALAIIAVLVAVVFGFLIWRERRRDAVFQQLIDSKEESIQRVAAENRMWRSLFLRDKCGWSPEQADRLVNQADFKNGPEARKALEEEGSRESAKPKKPKGGKS